MTKLLPVLLSSTLMVGCATNDNKTLADIMYDSGYVIVPEDKAIVPVTDVASQASDDNYVYYTMVNNAFSIIDGEISGEFLQMYGINTVPESQAERKYLIADKIKHDLMRIMPVGSAPYNVAENLINSGAIPVLADEVGGEVIYRDNDTISVNIFNKLVAMVEDDTWYLNSELVDPIDDVIDISLDGFEIEKITYNQREDFKNLINDNQDVLDTYKTAATSFSLAPMIYGENGKALMDYHIQNLFGISGQILLHIGVIEEQPNSGIEQELYY